MWGFYWLPVRALDAVGLPGAWGTLAITLAAVAVLAPLVVVRDRKPWRGDRGALGAIALGGVALRCIPSGSSTAMWPSSSFCGS